MDAFARVIALQELAYNVDGYTHSSSFFVLPEGETRFQPGTVWDFNYAYRYFLYGQSANAVGFKDSVGWLPDFYRIPSVLAQIKDVYCNELYPLVQQLLYGKGENQTIRSLDEWREHLSSAAAMNIRRWGLLRYYLFLYGDNFETEIDLLGKFLSERSEWMYQTLNNLHPDDDQHIVLWMDAKFACPDDNRFYTAPWQQIMAELVQAKQLSEADEESYALWQADVSLKATDGRSLADATVVLNGTSMTTHMQADGSLLIHMQFEDKSYRPVDYYGEDVGLVFNYDQYIVDYPEVAEYCEYDKETVLDYFFDEGLSEGHIGNGLFNPKLVAQQQALAETLLDGYLSQDWYNYYWEFLGLKDDPERLAETTVRFLPTIVDIP